MQIIITNSCLQVKITPKNMKHTKILFSRFPSCTRAISTTAARAASSSILYVENFQRKLCARITSIGPKFSGKKM